MIKLLCNSPSGKQIIELVHESGGYFDPARVIWDERVDGPLPPITLGGMIRVGNALEYSQARMDEHTPPQSLEQKRAAKKLALAVIAKAKRSAQITNSGVTVSIDDPDTLALLTGAKQGGKPTRKIVATSGRHELTKAEFDALVDAIDDYLQSVYNNHYDKDAAIDAAADETALNAVDVNSGWPA